MKTSKFTDEQIAMALRQAEAGTPVGGICRKLGVSEQSGPAPGKLDHFGVEDPTESTVLLSSGKSVLAYMDMHFFPENDPARIQRGMRRLAGMVLPRWSKELIKRVLHLRRGSERVDRTAYDIGLPRPWHARADGKVAAVTMVYNEPDYTPMWARHYSRHVGARNCYVVDHGSDDGSTDALGEVNVIRLPRSPMDDEKRARSISTLCGELLKSYNAVLHTDSDEFLVPDPRNYATLAEYAEAMPADVLTAIGLEIWQVPDQEPPIDLSRPITEQRRWTRFSSALCKPVLIRRPVQWSPGFHSSDAPTVFDTLYCSATITSAP